MAEPPVRRPTAADVTPKGFATRAIRAVHRLPEVHQSPTSVPIYQTVTFSTADAEELGAAVEASTDVAPATGSPEPAAPPSRPEPTPV